MRPFGIGAWFIARVIVPAVWSSLLEATVKSGTVSLFVVGYTKNDVEVFAEVVARSLAACGGSNKDIVHVAFGYGLLSLS